MGMVVHNRVTPTKFIQRNLTQSLLTILAISRGAEKTNTQPEPRLPNNEFMVFDANSVALDEDIKQRLKRLSNKQHVTLTKAELDELYDYGMAHHDRFGCLNILADYVMMTDCLGGLKIMGDAFGLKDESEQQKEYRLYRKVIQIATWGMLALLAVQVIQLAF